MTRGELIDCIRELKQDALTRESLSYLSEQELNDLLKTVMEELELQEATGTTAHSDCATAATA